MSSSALRRRPLAILGGLLLPLLLALPARAQTSTADTSDEATEAVSTSHDEEARALFEAGRIAFRDGRFEEARGHFLRSYELSGRAELLYNIASADDRLRHDDAALRGFEQYLAEVADAPNRAEVEARIAVLRAAIAANTPAAPSDGGAATPAATSSGPTVLFTWIAAGAALVTGALAIGFWVAANDQYAALDAGCLAMRGGCSRTEVASSGVETSVLLTNVFLVSSLVLTAATAIILPLELTSGSANSGANPEAPTAALRIGPGSLALEGSF
jgi:tetratricopeptide (TPR) repeat protein